MVSLSASAPRFLIVICANRRGSCAPPVVHPRFSTDTGRLTSLRGHRQELVDPRHLWPVGPATPAAHHDDRPNPRPFTWISRLPRPMLSPLLETRTTSAVMYLQVVIDLATCLLDRRICSPALRRQRASHGGALAGRAVSLSPQIMWPCRLPKRSPSSALRSASAHLPPCSSARGGDGCWPWPLPGAMPRCCVPMAPSLAVVFLPRAGHSLWPPGHAGLRNLCAPHCVVRAHRSCCHLPHGQSAQLAHLPCVSATRPPFCRRSWRSHGSRIPAMGKDLGG